MHAAWSAIRAPMGLHFREVYDRITLRRGKRIAIMPVAHRICAPIHILMRTHKVYCSSIEEEQRKLRFLTFGSLETERP